MPFTSIQLSNLLLGRDSYLDWVSLEGDVINLERERWHQKSPRLMSSDLVGECFAPQSICPNTPRHFCGTFVVVFVGISHGKAGEIRWS